MVTGGRVQLNQRHFPSEEKWVRAADEDVDGQVTHSILSDVCVQRLDVLFGILRKFFRRSSSLRLEKESRQEVKRFLCSPRSLHWEMEDEMIRDILL